MTFAVSHILLTGFTFTTFTYSLTMLIGQMLWNHSHRSNFLTRCKLGTICKDPYPLTIDTSCIWQDTLNMTPGGHPNLHGNEDDKSFWKQLIFLPLNHIRPCSFCYQMVYRSWLYGGISDPSETGKSNYFEIFLR